MATAELRKMQFVVQITFFQSDGRKSSPKQYLDRSKCRWKSCSVTRKPQRTQNEDCYLFSNNGHQYRENAVENFPRHMIWLILMLEYRDKKRVYIRLSFFGRFLNSQFFLFVFPARCM